MCGCCCRLRRPFAGVIAAFSPRGQSARFAPCAQAPDTWGDMGQPLRIRWSDPGTASDRKVSAAVQLRRSADDEMGRLLRHDLHDTTVTERRKCSIRLDFLLITLFFSFDASTRGTLRSCGEALQRQADRAWLCDCVANAIARDGALCTVTAGIHAAQDAADVKCKGLLRWSMHVSYFMRFACKGV